MKGDINHLIQSSIEADRLILEIRLIQNITRADAIDIIEKISQYAQSVALSPYDLIRHYIHDIKRYGRPNLSQVYLQ